MNSGKHHTFLNILPSLVFGLGLVAFLVISFVLYHRRLIALRKRDLETMDIYLYVHPDVTIDQYRKEKIPTRNRVKLMTNTHIDEVDELRLFQTTEQIMSPKQNKLPKVTTGKAWRNSALCAEGKEDLNEDLFRKGKYNSVVIEKSKHNNTQVKDTAETDIENVDTLITSKTGKNKRRNKKRRKYLQNLQHNSVTEEVALHSTTDLLSLTNSDFKRDTRNEIKSIQGTSSSLDEKADGTGPADYSANAYYADVGVAFSQIKRQKSMRIQKAETLEDPGNVLMINKPKNVQNAFYDKLTMKQDKKKHYKELVHRDPKGNLTHLSRSLPHLESDL